MVRFGELWVGGILCFTLQLQDSEKRKRKGMIV